jgi:hypothetical protein
VTEGNTGATPPAPSLPRGDTSNLVINSQAPAKNSRHFSMAIQLHQNRAWGCSPHCGTTRSRHLFRNIFNWHTWAMQVLLGNYVLGAT